MTQTAHRSGGFCRVMVLGYAATLALSACGTISPVPVNAANKNLNAAGFRYYETRPFIMVHKSFPIGADTILVDGMVSPDGKQVRLLKPLPKDFAVYLPASGSGASLPSAAIAPAPPATAAVQGQGAGFAQNLLGAGGILNGAGDKVVKPVLKDTDKLAGNAVSTVAGGVDQATGLVNGAQNKPPSSRAGVTSLSLRTDNAGTATVPVNDLFSIIFLPDYSREYLVDTSSSWFGTKQVHLTTAPGGGLLAINEDVDNSALVGPLMKTFTTLVSAGGLAAVAAINPAGGLVSGLGSILGQGSGFAQGHAQTPAPGSVVTLRLTKIRYAVPGIYPLAKPGEIAAPGAAVPPSSQGSFKVETPTAAYQVPYRYYEVIIAESLISPKAAILATAPAPAAAAGQNAAAGAGSPVAAANCSAGGKVSGSDIATAAALRKFVQKVMGDPNLDATVSFPPSGQTDGDHCLSSLKLKLSFGDTAKKKYGDPAASFKNNFAASYAGTTLDLP